MIDQTSPPEWRAMRPRRLLTRLSAAPGLVTPVDRLGRALLAALDGRTYETVALRVSARRDCPYTWRAHCLIARNHLTDPRTAEEIARIAAGPSALTGRDAAVAAAVDALLDRRTGTPTLRRLGRDEVPIVFATALYDAVTALMAEAEPEPDAVALTGLDTPLTAVRSLNRGSLT